MCKETFKLLPLLRDHLVLLYHCPLEDSCNFVPSLKNNYSLLEYDSSSGKMFCTLCRKHKKKNASQHLNQATSGDQLLQIIANPWNTLMLFVLLTNPNKLLPFLLQRLSLLSKGSQGGQLF